MTTRKEERTMTNTLCRLSVLLFVVVFVGIIGLNHSLNPQNVARIHAHAITLEISGTGAQGVLSFNAAINCDSTELAPSDSCTANLSVQNTGEGRVRMSIPSLELSGGLTTCGGGGWLTASLANVSYTASEIVNIGQMESF